MIVKSSVLGRGIGPAPSDRINLAVIGTGNQGINDLKKFLQDERVNQVSQDYPDRNIPIWIVFFIDNSGIITYDEKEANHHRRL